MSDYRDRLRWELERAQRLRPPSKRHKSTLMLKRRVKRKKIREWK